MYGDSQALSSSNEDSNPIMYPFSSKAIKTDNNGSFTIKSKELFMESDNINESIQQYHHQQNNPGLLLRFCSAPGSLFSDLSASAAAADDGVVVADKNGERCDLFHDDNKVVIENGYGVSSCSSQLLPPQFLRELPAASMAAHGGYGVVSNHLMRQSSSPPGLFSYLTTSQNEYGGALSGLGSYSGVNGVDRDFSPFARSRVKGHHQMSYLSGLGVCGVDDGKSSGHDNGGARFYSPAGFPFGSWSDSSKSGENFSGLKREVDINVPVLSRHSSLPENSSAMEKLLQFQDTVPCKLRAKRGFATHPRSIAERVRRTRISERMRKLQELVPNMDKQTNTADMLDLAVEYIKDLRKQHKILGDLRGNCNCPGNL